MVSRDRGKGNGNDLLIDMELPLGVMIAQEVGSGQPIKHQWTGSSKSVS